MFREFLGPVILAIVLIQWGPINVQLPGMPHVRITQLPEAVFKDPKLDLTGPLSPNTNLQGATVLFNNTIFASETVVPSEDGKSILMLDRYGQVFTASLDPSAPGGYSLDLQAPKARLPNTGRPLGFKWDGDGNIVVCLSSGGLVKLQMGGGPGGSHRVVTLASHVSDDSPIDAGSPLMYVNDVDIAADGTIYFTDSQSIPPTQNYGDTFSGSRTPPFYDTLKAYLSGAFAGSMTGRLCAYYPNNGSVHVLATGYWFANGVAVSQDGSFVVFAETNRYRVLRYWLRGSQAGKVDTLVEGLPGLPDGVNRATDGSFWVALPSRRGFLIDLMRNKFVRSVAAWMPFPLPLPPKWGAVVKVSPQGDITRFLMDPDGSQVSFITAVEESRTPDGVEGKVRLWMGSVREFYVSYVDV